MGEGDGGGMGMYCPVGATGVEEILPWYITFPPTPEELGAYLYVLTNCPRIFMAREVPIYGYEISPDCTGVGE